MFDAEYTFTVRSERSSEFVRYPHAPGPGISQVLGLLLKRVTGERLNLWAEDKLWKKIGAQRDAFFYESNKQPDTCAFACFSARLRDYGRVALMMRNRGQLGGKRVVSESWVHYSTTPDTPYLMPKPPGTNGLPTAGYAYQ
ncbi:MAG TPA: hypothetical protein VIY66_12950 [Candidatus Acidoferrales bacterium]